MLPALNFASTGLTPVALIRTRISSFRVIVGVGTCVYCRQLSAGPVLISCNAFMFSGIILDKRDD